MKIKLSRHVNITERTFKFAIDIVNLAEELNQGPSPARMLSSQVLRSGTSIGANVEEGQAAESKADFIHKYNIALKEARETRYWLKLLSVSNIEKKADLDSLITESDEVCRIIAQIIINARKRR